MEFLNLQVPNGELIGVPKKGRFHKNGGPPGNSGTLERTRGQKVIQDKGPQGGHIHMEFGGLGVRPGRFGPLGSRETLSHLPSLGHSLTLGKKTFQRAWCPQRLG